MAIKSVAPKPHEPDKGGNQWTSEVLVDHLMREAIRGYQRPSEAIRGHQRPSEAIKGHQRPSEVVRRHQSRTNRAKPKSRACSMGMKRTATLFLRTWVM